MAAGCLQTNGGVQQKCSFALAVWSKEAEPLQGLPALAKDEHAADCSANAPLSAAEERRHPAICIERTHSGCDGGERPAMQVPLHAGLGGVDRVRQCCSKSACQNGTANFALNLSESVLFPKMLHCNWTQPQIAFHNRTRA